MNKLYTLFVLFCFLVACTSSNPSERSRMLHQTDPRSCLLPKTTITPLSKKLHPSFNGGVISLDNSVEYASGNLWDRLPQTFQIPDESDNPAVQAHIRWFLKHPQYLDRTARRAAPYIYYIYEQVQQRQLPAELVLLPINESAYNPFATSVAGAGGIWQMTRGTASQYNVKQNWWYDGRRDVYTSTRAALDHLTYLQNFFNGDWLLALAAYDCGEGTVQRAIRRNAAQGKPTDFWSLSLPEETRAYVPRLLALAALLRDRQAYNLALPPIEDQPYLAQVDVDTPVSLAEAAQLSGMNLNELKQLNPGHKYTGKVPLGPYKLVLPIDRVDLFKGNLINRRVYASNNTPQQEESVNEEPVIIAPKKTTHPSNPLPSGQAITRIVKQGDNLSTIAKLYRVSTNDIKRWNHLHSSRLKPGTQIVVGFLDADTTHFSNPKKTQSPPNTRLATNEHYTVKRGDTLGKIAKRYQVSVSSLQVHNHLRHNQTLSLGQSLIIPHG